MKSVASLPFIRFFDDDAWNQIEKVNSESTGALLSLDNFMLILHEFCVNNNTNKARLFKIMNKVTTMQILYIHKSAFLGKFFFLSEARFYIFL